MSQASPSREWTPTLYSFVPVPSWRKGEEGSDSEEVEEEADSKLLDSNICIC
jgi:hypothetical protein